MTAKCDSQPFCRNCGKPIAKATETVYPKADAFGRGPGVDCYSRADCQAMVNEAVVSIRYSDPPTRWDPEREEDVPTGEPRRIYKFTKWDGESYDDDLFCSTRCAEQLGRTLARRGYGPRSRQLG